MARVLRDFRDAPRVAAMTARTFWTGSADRLL